MATTRIIFGAGYLGLRVGKAWKADGDHTWAVTRDVRNYERVLELGMAGMLTAHGDVTNASSLNWLPTLDGMCGAGLESVVFAVGYDRSCRASIEEVYAGGLKNVLAALPPWVTRVIYISTTGVYGPHAGEWVDESTPPDPRRDGGRASLAAEQVLAAHPLGRRSVILRLAGLYGPGRVPHLDKLRAGEPLPVPSEGWLNLIHVDDAARIVVAADAWLASTDAAAGPHVFCVSDGAPVRRADYYREAVRLLGAPPPRFTSPPPDSPAAERAAANRRIRNEKMRLTLHVALEFPSYRQGLAAILASP
jgi:nucleoside-diphosphate-sugar epimerase